uniref:Uncharacterized protein n=1 Tax=Caenorhabditis japonica TaxID=281687 RepID=A0A8R1HH43_CAEJA
MSGTYDAPMLRTITMRAGHQSVVSLTQTGRSPRAVTVAVRLIVVAIGAGLVPSSIAGICMCFLSGRQAVTEEETKDLWDALRIAFKHINHSFMKDAEHDRLFANLDINKIENTLFQKFNIDAVFDLLQIDRLKLMSTFGIPAELGMDIFRTFTYGVECGEQVDSVELNVCHWSSSSQKIGRVVKMAPKGHFIHARTYRYYETPSYAVVTVDGTLSASNCKKLGRIYDCELSPANCTSDKPAGCQVRTVETDVLRQHLSLF